MNKAVIFFKIIPLAFIALVPGIFPYIETETILLMCDKLHRPNSFNVLYVIKFYL